MALAASPANPAAHGPCRYSQQSEEPLNAILVRTLDRYFFPSFSDSRKGMFLGHCCIATLSPPGGTSHSAHPDLSVFSVDPAGLLPTRLLMPGEGKKLTADMAGCRRQLSIDAKYDLNTSNNRCLLGLTFSYTHLRVHVFVPVLDDEHIKVGTLDVASADLQKCNDVSAVCDTLKWAVLELLSNPIPINPTSQSQPWQDMEDTRRLHSGDVSEVFLRQELIHKFVKGERNQHADAALKVLNTTGSVYFQEFACTCFQHMHLIQYKYISPTTRISVQHFEAIYSHLCALHEKNIVHSDVRGSNIVFTDPPADSRLIDFELAGLVGESYPDGYNKLVVRHPSAKATFPRKVEHDLHALALIMGEYCCEPESVPNTQQWATFQSDLKAGKSVNMAPLTSRLVLAKSSCMQ